MKANQSQKNISTDWKHVRLGDLYTITSSKRVFQDEWTTEGVPFYRAREIVKLSEHGFVDNELFISRKMFEEYKAKYGIPQENDLLVTGVGTVGMVYRVTDKKEFYFKDGNIIWFKSKGLASSAFIEQLYKSPITKNKLLGSSPITTVATYTIDAAKKAVVHLPPLSEQNRIVLVLETWDKSIEKLTQKIEAKKQIKKALMEDLLNGKKRLAGFKDKWVNIQIGEVFSFLRTYAVSRENLINDTSNDQGLGNIHYGDIHSTYGSSSIDLRKMSVPQIKDTDFKFDKKDLLINGDLIMADVSEDYAGIGTTISIHELANKKILGGLHTFVLRDKSKMTTENYRQYIFQNEDIRNRLRKIANGVSVYGISKGNLSKMKLYLPSIQEQTIIANILTTADKEIIELEKKLSIIKEQKRYLLNNLITGTIRTPETLSAKITK